MTLTERFFLSTTVLQKKPFSISMFIFSVMLAISSALIDAFVGLIAFLRERCYCFGADVFTSAIKQSANALLVFLCAQSTLKFIHAENFAVFCL